MIPLSSSMTDDYMIVKNNPNVFHWNFEEGYDDDACETEYPRRIFNAKHGTGLVLFVQLFEKNFEYVCRGAVQGGSIQGFTLVSLSRQF